MPVTTTTTTNNNNNSHILTSIHEWLRSVFHDAASCYIISDARRFQHTTHWHAPYACIVYLMHADILFNNSVLLLHNSFLHFFCDKCPSSLWTQCHYNNPHLVIITTIIRFFTGMANKLSVLFSVRSPDTSLSDV